MNVSEMVLSGVADGELEEVLAAVRERRKTLARRTALELAFGDTIRFVRSTRPKYLAGLRATVESTDGTKVRCRILSEDAARAGRFAHGFFNCPVELVEKIEEAES